MLSFKLFLKEINGRTRDVGTASKMLDRITKSKTFFRSPYDADIDHTDSEQRSLIPQSKLSMHHFYHQGKEIERSDFRKKGQIREIDPKTFKSSQPTVSTMVVKRKLQGRWTFHDPEVPYAIHHNGTHYIVDGNHRAAQHRLTNTPMRAYVLDADPHKID